MFLNWQASDTGELLGEEAWLLQPDGKPIWVNLHGQQVFIWLAKSNQAALKLNLVGLPEQRLYVVGSFLFGGRLNFEPRKGRYWLIDRNGTTWQAVKDSPAFSQVKWHNGAMGDHVAELGQSLGDALLNGLLIDKEVSELVTLPYPIKLSVSPLARYEDLPPATLGDP